MRKSGFIIDPKGEIKAIWSNVKVKGHIDIVKSELAKLQNS
ncbi:MAG: hypothetical protein ACOX39_05840 [Arcobacteraceae bacterium]